MYCYSLHVTESDNQTCVDITYSGSGQCTCIMLVTYMSLWLLMMYCNSCPYNVISTSNLTITVDILGKSINQPSGLI